MTREASFLTVLLVACCLCLSDAYADNRAKEHMELDAEYAAGGASHPRSPDITAVISPRTQYVSVGSLITMNGSGSSDGDGEPGAYEWDFHRYASDNEPSITTTPDDKIAYFVAPEAGLYVVSLTVYEDVEPPAVPLSGDTWAVAVAGSFPSGTWVDFYSTWVEPEPRDGTPLRPYLEVKSTMDLAAAQSDSSVLCIADGETSETFDTTDLSGETFRLVAAGGPVRIGVAGAAQGAAEGSLSKSAQPDYGQQEPHGKHMPADQSTGSTGAATVLLAQLSGPHVLSLNGESDPDNQERPLRRHEDSTTHEPVLPFTRSGEGLQCARPDDVLAVRLRSGRPLDTDTIWTWLAAAQPAEAAVEWQPVVEGDLRDVWVLFQPLPAWSVGNTVTVEVGSLTVDGDPVAPARRTFAVSDAATDEADLEPLAGGVGNAWVVGPEQVYETPRQVWLPVPDDVLPEEAAVFYYHATGDDKGWYPAGNVAGWMVPDSTLHLRTNGKTYIGFLVRHAGIVQLGLGSGPGQ